MKNDHLELKSYQSPKLVEFGDIRELTAAASGAPGAMDSMYYLGYINNLNGCIEENLFS